MMIAVGHRKRATVLTRLALPRGLMWLERQAGVAVHVIRERQELSSGRGCGAFRARLA